MSVIRDLNRLMSAWNRKTFKQGIEEFYLIRGNNQWYEATCEQLEALGIANKRMNGSAVLGIKKNNIKTAFSFSEVFHRGVGGRFFSPATYFASLVKRCIDLGLENEATTGNVCRGFLSLPSFIREYDLESKLGRELMNKGVSFSTNSNPDLDVSEHTDLRISVNGRTYRLCSYLATANGLKYAKKKLRGQRGELKDGRYILCPASENQKYYGWYLYEDSQIERIVSLMLSDVAPMEYDDFLYEIDQNIRITCEFSK